MLVIDEQRALHAQVADHFREVIRSGRLRAGERLPSVRAVARQLGVSVTPVNAAFGLLVKEGLVYRRHGSGTFAGPRPSRAPEVLEIGLVFRTPRGWRQDDNFLLRLFIGIQEPLEAGECRTLLSTFRREIGPPTDIPKTFLERMPHGFLLDERASDELAANLAATGRPVISVERECAVEGVGSVCADREAAGAEAARRMLERGHRVVGVLGHPERNEPAGMRGFLRVMAEAGCAVPDSRVGVYPISGSASVADAKVMSADPRPTAVYCASDHVARQFYRWAESAGVRIPEDVSVVGTIDMELASQLTPPLTTFRFRPEEIGRTASEELIALCRDPERRPRRVPIEGTWIERESLVAI